MASSRTRELSILSLSSAFSLLIAFALIHWWPSFEAVLLGLLIGDIIRLPFFFVIASKGTEWGNSVFLNDLFVSCLVLAVIVGLLVWNPELTWAARGAIFCTGMVGIAVQLTYGLRSKLLWVAQAVLFLKNGDLTDCYVHEILICERTDRKIDGRQPHNLVDPLEARYWWSVDAFARLLDRILDYPFDASPKISITFDDGNASDYLFALPELAKRRLKASFFVCAGRIGTKNYLDGSMIRDLLGAGMNIGSHGMHHLDWRTLNLDRLDVEIVEARRKIEDVSQTAVEIVAIPFGSYDGRILKKLNQ